MKVLDRAAIDKEDLRHVTEGQLARLGIRIVDRGDLTLECIACGETWSPQLDSSGKLPHDYSVCPAKCNI